MRFLSCKQLTYKSIWNCIIGSLVRWGKRYTMRAKDHYMSMKKWIIQYLILFRVSNTFNLTIRIMTNLSDANIQILDDLMYDICVDFVKRYYKEMRGEELQGNIDVFFYEPYWLTWVDIWDCMFSRGDIYTAQKMNIPMRIVQNHYNMILDAWTTKWVPNLYNYFLLNKDK